ncbi:MAG: hypothetical protein Ct9H90mP5_08810 [Acidimicrobiaceae bacterium]|nr:MAG: hypothetical protein Ct9H90mP5_08810 [Acidimicrobiaceae bacterium]
MLFGESLRGSLKSIANSPEDLPTQEKIGWMNQPMRAKAPKTPEDHNQGKVLGPVFIMQL